METQTPQAPTADSQPHAPDSRMVPNGTPHHRPNIGAETAPMTDTSRTFEFRASWIVILSYVTMLGLGSQVLAGVFEFPDILREPAAYRLNLFSENMGLIASTYYIMAFTGILQCIIAVLVHQCFQNRGHTLLILATVFGILCGAWQVMGFLRWTILIPYIAEGMTEATASAGGLAPETVAFIEGWSNRYIGMAVGEHLGFLGQMFWTLFLGLYMLKEDTFDRRLAWFGVAFGVLLIPVTLEPLGGPFKVFAEWPMFVVTGWAVWMSALGISMIRADAASGKAHRLGWKMATFCIVMFLAFTLPALGG